MNSSLGLPFRSILLTGGGGFVGRQLAPLLAAAAPDAARLILSRSGGELIASGWQATEVDLTDGGAVEAVVAQARPDLVVHLAAQSSVAASRDTAEMTWRVNFDGSFALARACARYAPDCTMLFTSSSEVYGESFRDGPAGEETPLRPLNVYARSKAAAEMVLADVLPPTAKLVVARAFNHTGPGQDERFVLPSFALQVARIEAGLQTPVMMVGNIDVARDFLHLRDVCEAYLDLLRAAPELPPRSIFNIASGTSVRLRDLLERMRAASRVPFAVTVDPVRLRSGDIARAEGRGGRLHAATGWRPRNDPYSIVDELLEVSRAHVANLSKFIC